MLSSVFQEIGLRLYAFEFDSFLCRLSLELMLHLIECGEHVLMGAVRRALPLTDVSVHEDTLMRRKTIEVIDLPREHVQATSRQWGLLLAQFALH